jgi:hypothetical protein
MSNITSFAVAGAPFVADSQYTHQFFVTVSVSTVLGGTTSNKDNWYDQTAFVTLNATASKHWSFAYWRGGTPSSYNGTTQTATFAVSGPANETAIFFPGLAITTGDGGSVSYKYGSINGTVPGGSNRTIYPPPGRNVTLTAIPNTVQIMFTGWLGPHSGSQLRDSVAISSPATVTASFAIDYSDIRTFAVATLGVFIAASYIFVIKRGIGRSPKP